MRRRESRSALMSCSSNEISRASREMRMSSQERHPGWVKRRTRVCRAGSDKGNILRWFIILPLGSVRLRVVLSPLPGLTHCVPDTHGWRRGLHSAAASRLGHPDICPYLPDVQNCRASLDWTADGGRPYMGSSGIEV